MLPSYESRNTRCPLIVSESLKELEVISDSLSPLYLLVTCVCLLLLAAGFLLVVIYLLDRRRKNAPISGYPGYAGQEQALQDQGGNWWYQDPATAAWYIWNGQAWHLVPAAAPRIISSHPAPRLVSKPRRWGSCLLALLAAALVALVVVGGISLLAYNFFPAYHIDPGQGELTEILKMGGGGLLLTVFGVFMLNGGFRTLLTGRAVVEDDWGRHTEKRGCSALLNGLGQLFFGLFFLAAGLALLTLALYQEILPWLGI
jgi:hypothetical protein